MASSIASLLGVFHNDLSKPFCAMFGGGEQQPSSDVFAMPYRKSGMFGTR